MTFDIATRSTLMTTLVFAVSVVFVSDYLVSNITPALTFDIVTNCTGLVFAMSVVDFFTFVFVCDYLVYLLC